MAWDWEADDIHNDKEDRKEWVPVTTQTLEMGEAMGGKQDAQVKMLMSKTGGHITQMSQTEPEQAEMTKLRVNQTISSLLVAAEVEQLTKNMPLVMPKTP